MIVYVIERSVTIFDGAIPEQYPIAVFSSLEKAKAYLFDRMAVYSIKDITVSRTAERNECTIRDGDGYTNKFQIIPLDFDNGEDL